MKRSAAVLALIPARQILYGMFVILAFRCLLSAQQERENSFPDEQILSEIGQHNELMTNIEYLSDVIGPRLTGSSQQRMASEWAEREFQRYGLTNIHQEKWMVARSWTRGTAEARVIAPVFTPSHHCFRRMVSRYGRRGPRIGRVRPCQVAFGA